MQLLEGYQAAVHKKIHRNIAARRVRQTWRIPRPGLWTNRVLVPIFQGCHNQPDRGPSFLTVSLHTSSHPAGKHWVT
jgi:hypothetical protein